MITQKSKIFFIVLLIIFFLSVAYTYYDTIVLRRFTIFTTEEEIPTYADLFEKIKDFPILNVQ